MPNQQINEWWHSWSVYRNPRVLSLLFLGFSSGLPFGVLAEPLTAWLFEAGTSKTAIGLFALVSLPYSIKFVWAPFMDHIQAPILGRIFGRRRGWALLTQFLLLACICGLGSAQPEDSLLWIGILALAVAFASASQDIVIDAYRVEILSETQLAAGAACATGGWRVGQLGGAAAGLILADILPWSVVFYLLGSLIVIGIITILLNPEPKVDSQRHFQELEERIDDFLEQRKHLPEKLARTFAWLYAAFAGPLAEFMQRKHWLPIMLFILLYKYGDAILSVMKMPFFLELGFSKTEIAEIAKVFGFNAIILGGFLGGWVLARMGIMKGLLVCGVLMALSNLIFIAQAMVGHNLAMLTVTIAVENITTGMGTTAFVAYLSSLCNISYTATQYALLTSLMAFSRTVMSSGAGWLADKMDWISFFVLTTFAALPGLILLVWLYRALDSSVPAEAKTGEAVP